MCLFFIKYTLYYNCIKRIALLNKYKRQDLRPNIGTKYCKLLKHFKFQIRYFYISKLITYGLYYVKYVCCFMK